jgi:cyclic pyranopterin phosphate synthase
MPGEGVAWLPRDEVLSFEEIVQVLEVAARSFGIRRVKLTGGEPTIRHGIVELVRMLRATTLVDDLSMTTNGALLETLAEPLLQAGLDRVTVSLDSLRSDRFKAITRQGELSTVLRGVERAIEAGFKCVKINVVAMRGLNDDEIADFARISARLPVTVRFIEYMPLGDAQLVRDGNRFAKVLRDDGGVSYDSRRIAVSETGPAGGCGAQHRGNVFIPEHEVRALIEQQVGRLIPVARDSEPGVGPAVPYRLDVPGARGRLGFISAMSQPFCATCNRLRLTADGVLRSCLFEGGSVPIRGILRSEADPELRAAMLSQAMVRCVTLRPDVHSHYGSDPMSRIGG